MADQLITGTTLIEDKRSEAGTAWSIKGVGFINKNPDVDDTAYNTDYGSVTATAGTDFLAPVNLPNGVTIKSIKATGTDSTNSLNLYKIPLGTQSQTIMATGVLNTEYTSITEPVIDNRNFGYFIKVECGAGDTLYDAAITYD